MIPYAHTHPAGEAHWEPLQTHADEVARLASLYAGLFGGEALGAASGWLHDLGKIKPAFQRRLRDPSVRVGHSGEGAVAATAAYADAAPLGRLLAFAIAGHHSGLANGIGGGGGLSPLDDRLVDAETLALPTWLDLPTFDLSGPDLPHPLRRERWRSLDRDGQAFALQFLGRMLFSCLVDADRTATNAFERDVRAEVGTTDLAPLLDSLNLHLATFPPPTDDVGRARSHVLAASRATATSKPGLFSLTVPTGGGKTLSSLAFALEHARAHGLARVIHVAPFTAIIEQTARVFREALKDDAAVLEHHSAFEAEETFDRQDEDEAREAKRVMETWDAPVVVTTAVQLFEGLFANRTSRCRKLHRLAGAVIVLDEAQALPLHVLRPCLRALTELAEGYGSTVVLCTATQPAVTRAAGAAFPEALVDVREIVPDPRDLYKRLRRVRVADGGTMTDAQIVAEMDGAPQALAIVNTRRHARELADRLGDGARHLTTAMTGRHRRAVLEEVRADLAAHQSCRLVSTSLIEAGVDISFPLVLRASAGLDSLAQAAGRCNRSGELGPLGGRVVAFTPAPGEGRTPPPELARFAEVAAHISTRHEDPLSLDALDDYFGELYWRSGPDRLDATRVRIGEKETTGIARAFTENLGNPARGGPHTPYASIAAAFRLIGQTMKPVIVPHAASPDHGAPADLLHDLEYAQGIGGLARRLQPYTVPVPDKARLALVACGSARMVRAEEFADQFVVLTNDALYGETSGLNWDDPTYRTVESNIC